MTVLTPTSLDGALAALAERPDAHVLAGGTDLMVEVNFGHRRPPAVVALAGVAELRGWRREDDRLWLGAGLTYTEMLSGPLAEALPALAQAARTVGSPQIRNAGTIGGNLGTASPAGDTLPVLAALEAVVEVRSAAHGTRSMPIGEFLVGVKRTALAPGELVVGVWVPASEGPQHFLKVGVRNAMVIAVCSLALVVDHPGRAVRIALGAVGPTVVRATVAEATLADAVAWPALRLPGGAPTVARVAAEVGGAARPIDDHRSTAAYRRHAVEVLARRALERTFP